MHPQTQSEWEEEMSEKILTFLQNEIYLDLRYLKPALSALAPKADGSLQTFGTDGMYLHYSAEQVIRVFKSNGRFLNRAYLHTILHCIFSHLWLAGEREMRLWNLSCDIVAEYTIDKLDKPCTRRILSWIRQEIYQKMEEERQGISAAVVYRQLRAWLPDAEKPEEKNSGDEKHREFRFHITELEKEFYTDDHRYWPKREDDAVKQQIARQSKEKWKRIARQTKMEQELRGEETEDGEELFAAQIKAGRGRRSYQDFLRRFSVPREELHCDPDEFDVNYYSYGLRFYGNMPLVEPVESREVYQIQEFVVAVDTSYSTSGELVENFLKETFDILMQRNRFSRRSKVRIIQCDNQVRMDEEITTEEQLSQLFENFEVSGGGGTDFRPVFAYVNNLIDQGQIKNLGGLLYFTDGKGIYPKKRPEYKTAFLFLKEYEEESVPPWAMRVKLEPEEFESEY